MICGFEEELNLESLTLEEKVGQVFMFGFHGKHPSDATRLFEELLPGGIIYFARNTGTVEEVSALSRTLQEYASQAGSGIPLLIAADQEGGIVSRLKADIPEMPGPMALAAAVSDHDFDLVAEASRAMGVELRAAGINMNLAPVLDVNNNPENPVIGIRSFGEDPNLVADLGVMALRGFLSAGVIPVGKHFPGHGNTSVDSHLALPVLSQSMAELDSCELIPFKAAIQANIPAIMSAHIVFQAIDSENPATLSSAVITDLLRGNLGFGGLVITDCLEMNAISKYPGTPKGAVSAFKAGCDLLLISHTYEFQKQAYFALLEAVKTGEISEHRLDDSVNRILRLKESFALPNDLPSEAAHNPLFDELSRSLHIRSITVVRNENGVIPLHPVDGETLRICVAAPKPRRQVLVENPVEKRNPSTSSTQKSGFMTDFAASISRLCPETEITEISMQDPNSIEQFVSASQRTHVTFVLSENATINEDQAAFIQRASSELPDLVLIATKNPYDISVAPSVHTYICTYGSQPEAMEALAKVLLGLEQATGSIPVAIGGI
jgi:beta-N-acetylhexosaminidase